jgi:UDP-glucuronate decarboxylase
MTISSLVTGGAGFLGSHLCERLLQDDRQVICLDNFGSGRQGNIEHLTENPDFEVVSQDIRRPVGLPKVDEIYHLASRASPKDFTEFPVKIALTNTQGTRNILEHASACGATLVYASTSEVYGDPEEHPQREDYNGNVNIRGPRGCYDESKRFGETLTVAYRERTGVDVRTARIFNTYGPRMRPDDGRVIPNFLSQAVEDNPLTVYGDGKQTRSFCYVDDLIDGLVSLMNTDGLGGEVVNLGNDDEINIKQLAELIIESYDTQSGITYEVLPEDDPSKRQPDLAKAKEVLDWEPQISLKTGLSKTYEYFEEVIE